MGKNPYARGVHFFRLTARQRLLLAQHVKGRSVLDIGGRTGELAQICKTLGAKSTALLDTHPDPVEPMTTHAVNMLSLRAEEAYRLSDVLLLSWPECTPDLGALPPKLGKGKTLIYLGSNHDGTACGSASFWKQIVHNKVLGHVDDRQNTMIVYGLGQPRTTKLLWEEYNGTVLETKEIQPYRAGWSPHPFQTEAVVARRPSTRKGFSLGRLAPGRANSLHLSP